jgi:hypothetical protein
MNQHQRWRVWQVAEGGPLVEAHGTHPWYNNPRFGWRKSYRVAELQRHPVCTLCQKRASEIVDHIRPFINAEGYISWALFSSPENHRALCRPCHSRLTGEFDGGFGNERKAGKEVAVMPTGDGGKQFSSGSIGSEALDRALGTAEDLAELLSDIPDL